MGWLDILLLGVVGLFIFPKLLPLRYYDYLRVDTIKAESDRVWNSVDIFSKDYNSRITGNTIIENESDNPDQVILRTKSGSDVLIQRTDYQKWNQITYKILDPNNQEPLFGSEAFETVTVEAIDAQTTKLHTSQRMGFRNPLEAWFYWPNYSKRYYKQFASSLENEQEISEISHSSLKTEVLMFLVSLALFSWWLGFAIGLALMIAIVVHELGHAVALKLIGEKVYAIRILPLFGGITIGSRPNTAFKNAFYSLGGALFSGLAILGVYMVAVTWAPPVFSWDTMLPQPENLTASLLSALILAAVLNLFQLLPIGILDGGQTLDAMLSGANRKLRNTIVTILLLLIIGSTLHVGGWFFGALFALISVPVLKSMFAKDSPQIYEPSTWQSGAGVLALYGFTIAINIAAIGLPAAATVDQLSEFRSPKFTNIFRLEKDYRSAKTDGQSPASDTLSVSYSSFIQSP